MTITREQAVALAIRYYAGGQAAVVRSRAELHHVQTRTALVLALVRHSSEAPEFDVPGPQTGPGWWIAFDELWQRDGVWDEPDVHPSGGLVRVCEVTGGIYQPILL